MKIQFHDQVSRTIYLIATIILYISAIVLFFLAGMEMYAAIGSQNTIEDILQAISLIILAVAIADVGNYVFEEEYLREDQLRNPDEARRTLTKFIVIIFVALSLEGLINVFIASKNDMSLLLYPSVLIGTSSLLIFALGFYQYQSVRAEGRISRGYKKYEQE